MATERANKQKGAEWLPLAQQIIAHPENVPNLLKRCIVGVLENSKNIRGSDRERFEAAVAICGECLKKAGRLDTRMAPEVARLTSLGHKRDKERKRQPDQARKARVFDLLIAKLRRDEKDEIRREQVRARGKAHGSNA